MLAIMMKQQMIYQHQGEDFNDEKMQTSNKKLLIGSLVGDQGGMEFNKENMGIAQDRPVLPQKGFEQCGAQRYEIHRLMKPVQETQHTEASEQTFYSNIQNLN